MERELTIGAIHLGGGRTRFRVWAPAARAVEVELVAPRAAIVPMARDEQAAGYWQATVDDAGPGTRYLLRLDGARGLPDPASRFQPEDVGGPSEVVDVAAGWAHAQADEQTGEPQEAWDDAAWTPPPLCDYVLYELHVGTFTPEGTFDAVIPHLPYLRRLGVTAVELMPVAQFPGARNWGYDGVFPFAVQASYGGPAGLRRLVAACHRHGLAVVLDVVHNHLGPEGEVLADFAPYYTNRYRTPWGPALNFDGPASDEVRRFFIESALTFARDYHVDAFRLDAVHIIVDSTAYPFVEELTDALHAEGARRGHPVLVMAESNLNDPRLVRAQAEGGWGLDAMWNDDYHYAAHALVTGETHRHYADFGAPEHLERVLRDAFAYTGDYSTYRRRRHGRPAAGIPPERFVVATQNHDQVGNRAHGERLPALAPPEAVKALAALLLLSPFTPMLFMGEEYGETAPFLYFVSHSDPVIVDMVRNGRRGDFEEFARGAPPPDPLAESTFARSRLDHALAEAEPGATLLALHTRLIALRRALPRAGVETARPIDRLFRLRYSRSGTGDGADAIVIANLGDHEETVTLDADRPAWRLALDTAAARWGGPGSGLPDRGGPGATLTLPPMSAALYLAADE